MTQLAGSPLVPQPGRLGDLAKLPAHLPAIQDSAILTAEDKPVILPCIASPQPYLRLPPGRRGQSVANQQSASASRVGDVGPGRRLKYQGRSL